MTLVCWKCGASLDVVPQPLSRYARCPACDTDLYVCRLCEHYDPRYGNACREERAEPPREPDRANFCDWFKPRPNAYEGGSAPDRAARGALEALFGGSETNSAAEESKANPLDDLFK